MAEYRMHNGATLETKERQGEAYRGQGDGERLSLPCGCWSTPDGLDQCVCAYHTEAMFRAVLDAEEPRG